MLFLLDVRRKYCRLITKDRANSDDVICVIVIRNRDDTITEYNRMMINHSTLDCHVTFLTCSLGGPE